MVKVVKSRIPRKKVLIRRKVKPTKKDESSDDSSVGDYGPLSDKLTTDLHFSDGDENGSAHSDLDSEDSDFEIQVALREGLLQKNGLNIVQKQTREKINKKKEMEEKHKQYYRKRKFIETLAVSVQPEFSYIDGINSDFDREAAFMKQAQSAVAIALPKLQTLKVPIFRPDDYFAEMAKSDKHMQKVRHHILDIQKDKEKRESSRRLREEKRFALKIQGAAEDRKRKEKRKLLEAVKKHRKGVKGQLEQMLNNKSTYDIDDDVNTGKGQEKRNWEKRRLTRSGRDKKFGFGGKKKRSKQNDRDSHDNPFTNGKKSQPKFGRNKRHGR